jgi:hypothetical protein
MSLNNPTQTLSKFTMEKSSAGVGSTDAIAYVIQVLNLDTVAITCRNTEPIVFPNTGPLPKRNGPSFVNPGFWYRR